MKAWVAFGIVGSAALAVAQGEPPMLPPAGPGAAQLTIEQGGTWFTLNEVRSKTKTSVPAPVREPEGLRHSAVEPKTISGFEVTARLVVRKGPMGDADPLAFEGWSLPGVLASQVSPPKQGNNQ